MNKYMPVIGLMFACLFSSSAYAEALLDLRIIGSWQGTWTASGGKNVLKTDGVATPEVYD